MSTDPTTHKLTARLQDLAIEVDEITHQLVARDDLTADKVSLALYLLSSAVDELNTALYTAEEVFDLRIQAEYLDTARVLADPLPPGDEGVPTSRATASQDSSQRISTS